MKKVLILTILLVAGCAETTKTTSSAELMKPLRPEQPISKFAQEWVEKYGNGPESVEHYNIALARQILNNQGLAIDKLRKRMEALEAARKELADKCADIECKLLPQDCKLLDEPNKGPEKEK